MGAYEDMMYGTEGLSSAPDKGLLGNAWDDVTNTLSNYGTGAIQGIKEQWKQESNLNQIAAVDEYGNVTPREGYTQQQVNEQQDLTRAAQNTFAKETIAPVVGGAAIGLTAGSLAAPATLGTAAGVAGTAYLPFMAGDIASSHAKGGVGQVARDLTYGGITDWYNQPDLAKQLYGKPISTAGSGLMAIAPLLFMGRGLHESLTSLPKVNEKGIPLKEPNPSIADDFNNFKPAEETVKEIPAPVSPVESPPTEVQASTKGSDIIAAGEQQLGTPYQLGADGINATDCGKFTQDTLAKNGINLDYRTADGQYLQLQNEGKTFTSEAEAQVGDLVFFDVHSNRKTWSPSDDPASVNSNVEAYKGVTHVGIYAGEGKVLQAGSHGVSYANINAFGDIVGFGKTAGEGKGKSTTATAPIRNEKSSAEATRQIAEDQANADIVSKDLSDIVNKSEETWKMSKEKYDKLIEEEPTITTAEKASYSHEKIVEQAIKEEKPVPMEVLKDYPELVAKYPAEIVKIESKLNQGEQASLGGYSTIPAETTYSKPVTRSEIIKDVNELIPARAGRVGSFEGLYKGDPGVIRSKNYGDVETLSHEIGHFVDSKLNIVGHDAELINAADTQWVGNKSYDKYTPEHRRAEGIAEFGRQYMINQAEALKNFPTYGKDFVAKLATDKKLANQVENISNKMRAWHAQSPLARARGGMSFGYENEKTFISKAQDKAFKAYELVFDDKLGLTKFVRAFEKATGFKLMAKDNPERLSRVANSSATSKADMLITSKEPEAVIKALNQSLNGAMIHDVTFTSIVDRVMKEIGIPEHEAFIKEGNWKNPLEAFSTYLVARRQIEIQGTKANYVGSMSKDVAKHLVDNSPEIFEDIAQDFYNYNDNLMRARVQSGLTTVEEYNQMKSKGENYAHMAREFDVPTKSDSAKGLTDEGSGRNVIDPLQSAITDTYSTMSSIEKNNVKQTFVRMSDIMGAGRFIEKVEGKANIKDSTFSVITDGKRQTYQTEPEFYRAIISMDEPTSNYVIDLMSPQAKWLRTGAVLSPEFFVKNPIKDTLDAYVYSHNNFIPVIDTIKGLYTMFKNEELYNEYKSSGVMMSGRLEGDRGALNNKISDAMMGVSYENPIESSKALVSKLKAMNAPERVIKFVPELMRTGISSLQWLTDVSETSTRLGEYAKARGSGKSIVEAALDAQDLTINFSRGGSFSKQANKVIPFFNAALQGTDKMSRAFYNNPMRTSARITASIVVPSIVIALLGIDDQEIQELPDYEKNAFWIMRAGDNLVRIPKPLGLNTFANITEEAIRHMYSKNPKSIKEFSYETAKTFVPNLLPTSMLSVVEWAANYSFFKDKQIVPQALQNATPSKQYNTYTSETAKVLGSVTNQSPMKIDNFITNVGGGLAAFAVLGIDKGINAVTGGGNERPAKNITEIPAIKSFFSKNSKSLSQSTEQFYDKMKELEQDHAENGKKGIIKNELQKYRHANTDLQDIYKKTKEILANDKLDAAEKRSKTDDLQQKHNKIILKALGK
jgi:cell wall-associated NlpC family hydrolase